jgi:hypothetical protein
MTGQGHCGALRRTGAEPLPGSGPRLSLGYRPQPEVAPSPSPLAGSPAVAIAPPCEHRRSRCPGTYRTRSGLPPAAPAPGRLPHHTNSTGVVHPLASVVLGTLGRASCPSRRISPSRTRGTAGYSAAFSNPAARGACVPVGPPYGTWGTNAATSTWLCTPAHSARTSSPWIPDPSAPALLCPCQAERDHTGCIIAPLTGLEARLQQEDSSGVPSMGQRTSAYRRFEL